MSGLVYQRLVAGSDAELPESLVSGFRSRYGDIVRDNLMKTSALTVIDDAFESEGIRAVAVKGVALSRNLYDDPGLRPMADIDLILHPEDHSRGVHALLTLGYTRDGGHPTVFSLDQTLDVKSEPLGIERIRARAVFSLPDDWLWRQTVDLEGCSWIRTWSEPVSLYTGVIHALKHGFPEGIWLTDLGEMLQKLCDRNLSAATRIFGRTGNERALGLALMRIEHWGYALPEALSRWRRSKPTALVVRGLDRFARTGGSQAVEAAYLATDSRNPAVTSLLEAFFPNEAVFESAAMQSAGPLKYALRIIDVVWTLIRSIFEKKQGV